MSNRVSVRYLLVPGGSHLFRGKKKDNGYDAATRAIVSTDFDETVPYARKVIYDFKKPTNGNASHVRWNNDRWEYLLMPGETVNIGLGIVLAMRSNTSAFTYIAARGSSGVLNIELFKDDLIPEYIRDQMGGIFIDSNFRAEPIARITNGGSDPFPIWQGRRIVQIGFRRNVIEPKFIQVSDIGQLGTTDRGNKCHGSSGA